MFKNTLNPESKRNYNENQKYLEANVSIFITEFVGQFKYSKIKMHSFIFYFEFKCTLFLGNLLDIFFLNWKCSFMFILVMEKGTELMGIEWHYTQI
jgi:hypothetical protein